MTRRATRRSQSVVPFGVGAIVEFEDEALMAAGIDAWPDVEGQRLYDDRLARRLGVDHFRQPPPRFDKNGTFGTMGELPYVRFPEWHFCPRCRALKRLSLFDQRRARCSNSNIPAWLGKKGWQPCGMLPEKRRPCVLPIRFVAVCEAGHIEDFPWHAWVHAEKGKDLSSNGGCTDATLYFRATSAGGLSGLLVECSSCERRRSLMGATEKTGLKGLACSGNRPWLGGANEPCAGTRLFGVQRGASNIYFPETTSSILIPPYSKRVNILVSDRRFRELIDTQRVDGIVPQNIIEFAAKERRVSPTELRMALDERQAEEVVDTEIDETAFRLAEYKAMLHERRDEDDLLTCRPQRIASYGSLIQENFEHVALVERLAETRALVGFYRWVPGMHKMAPLSTGQLNWRPAFRVMGEGLFLIVNQDKLKSMSERVDDRIARLAERAKSYRLISLEVTPQLVFLHTLAHALIKRLSFEAGYGASSIRERLYSSASTTEGAMGGILLYTAAGDADGTLGGLVGLGRAGALDRVLAGALEDVRWCASDPICGESGGQGPGSLNLAACHACSLLPETSCEMQNRLLDRRVVQDFFMGCVETR